MPKNTVKVIKPPWLPCEMNGRRPMLSCWLWISTLLFGLDWTNSRYRVVWDYSSVAQKLLCNTINLFDGATHFCWFLNADFQYEWIISILAFRLMVILDLLTAGTWALPAGQKMNQAGTNLVCTWMWMENGRLLSAIKLWTVFACRQQVGLFNSVQFCIAIVILNITMKYPSEHSYTA